MRLRDPQELREVWGFDCACSRCKEEMVFFFGLVGGLDHFLFLHILGIITSIDSYFSEGWLNHQPVAMDGDRWCDNGCGFSCRGGPGQDPVPSS